MTEAALARKTELEEALGRIVRNLVDRYRPTCIILFGSLARGECHEDSDIDLVVIKETATPWLDRMVEAQDAADSSEAMDIVVYTPAEWREMLRQGNYFLREEVLGKGKLQYGDPGGVDRGS